ncbi:MAG: MFS transporter [Pseudohongiella sp.]|uniref:MFS transporter n=1 Tax=Pseudohongiella sp. TaxID=1979412 RepID=UPI00349FD416
MSDTHHLHPADSPPGRLPIVLSLGVVQTLGWGSTYYLPAILAVPIAEDLGLSTGNVFGAFSLALVLSGLLGPMIGRRIDHRGGRPVLVMSSVLFALGLLLLSQAVGPVTLWLAWLVIGVGMAMGLYEAAFSTLAGIYGSNARNAITGITLIAGFASTICWPITAGLESTLGWRGACLVWAAAHLVIGLPLNRLVLPRMKKTRTVLIEEGSTPKAQGKGGLTMALLAFVFAVTWFTSTAMAAHLPRLLQESGLPLATAVLVAGLVGPAQVGARFLEYALLQRFHPLLSARMASLTHPLGVVCVLALGSPVAALFTVLHGAGNGILTIAKGTLPLAIFGPQDYGLRQGWLMMPARVSQAFAPVLFAVLIDRFGLHALLLSAALGCLAFIALMFIKPVLNKS